MHERERIRERRSFVVKDEFRRRNGRIFLVVALTRSDKAATNFSRRGIIVNILMEDSGKNGVGRKISYQCKFFTLERVQGQAEINVFSNGCLKKGIMTMVYKKK